jgi:hypothetical protein
MSLQNSAYHRVLRISVLVFAVVLIFQSGLASESTAKIARGTAAYVATAVGMSAGVQPTQLNQYTAALTQKEQELAAREAALAAREIEIGLSAGEPIRNDSTYVLASILFILLVLIILNYVLDFLRSQERAREQAV